MALAWIKEWTQACFKWSEIRAMNLQNQATRHTIRARSRNTYFSWVRILTRAREFRPLPSTKKKERLFAVSVELNAQDTKLTI